MPKISIIVPIYKVEPYLHKCIDSILNQTFSDFELILVDDGSPDNCPQICNEYAVKDERIKTIHRRNGGLSAARNSGLNIAKGDYICFVDSDDFIHPQYCELLLNEIEKSNFDFCVCDITPFKDENTVNTYFPYNNVISTHITLHEYFQNSKKGVWNKIYKRNVFDNIRFFDGRIHEDIMFATDLLNIIKTPISVIDAKLYFARSRSDSLFTLEKIHPDRVFAGEYMISKAFKQCPELFPFCLKYAIIYPWSFVDKIYVKKDFSNNKKFLCDLQNLIRKYKKDYKHLETIDKITKHRMLLFSRSRFLYSFNAYGRLLRVYLYRSLKKDPYKTGHGI